MRLFCIVYLVHITAVHILQVCSYPYANPRPSSLQLPVCDLSFFGLVTPCPLSSLERREFCYVVSKRNSFLLRVRRVSGNTRWCRHAASAHVTCEAVSLFCARYACIAQKVEHGDLHTESHFGHFGRPSPTLTFECFHLFVSSMLLS